MAGSQANAAAALQQNVAAALEYGKEASKLAQQQAMMKGGLRSTTEAIDQAHDAGKIDDKQTSDLTMASAQEADRR